MFRAKKIISGKRIAPGIVEVDISGKSRLFQGQKVLVYKPTDKDIIGHSGKVIGKKERILGIGEVVISGDKVVVKTPQSLIHPQLSRKPIRISKASIGSRKMPSKKMKLSSVMTDSNVYIKPVEE